MHIIATICCRGGSKGVKQKNIRLLRGKPLIAYTIEAARATGKFAAIVVSTDSEAIAEVARAYGIRWIFMRPDELATDTASKWHVFRHVVEQYEKETDLQVDYMADLDVTVPLKTREDISGAVDFALKNEDADVIITAYPPERNPYFNMMEIQADGFATLVKKTATPIVRRQDAPKVLSLTPAVYMLKKEALYQFDHWSNARCKLFEIPRERAIDIDTEIDFSFVEFLLHAQQKLI